MDRSAQLGRQLRHLRHHRARRPRGHPRLGFSSILCASGATWGKSAPRYFAQRRRQLRDAGWRFTEVWGITHPARTSDLYRRQSLAGSAGGSTGEIVLDYDFTTSVDGVNYSYQRSVARYANSRAWRDQRGVLNRVQRSLAYSGPGAPVDEDPDL